VVNLRLNAGYIPDFERLGLRNTGAGALFLVRGEIFVANGSGFFGRDEKNVFFGDDQFVQPLGVLFRKLCNGSGLMA
jgi:hypothetical protein